MDAATLEAQKTALQERHAKRMAQLDARIKDARARSKDAERKKDTRRKIILGGLAQAHMLRNPESEFARIMANMIETQTIGAKERALFDLPPLPETEEQNRRNAQDVRRKKA